MKASAPKWLVAVSQLFEKIFSPCELNHDVDCWLVETAIRTRITSTSRPDASARAWKARSPSGRRCDRGWVDPAGPAGPAGSTCVTALTTSRPDLRVSQPSPLAADLAQLRLGLLIDIGGQRRVTQLGEQFLAVSEQVAEVRLEHGRVIRVRLGLVDQIPRLVGDRVRGGAGRPDRGERQVAPDGGLAGGGRGGRVRRRDVAARLVLDRGVAQAGSLSGGVVHVPDGAGGGLDDLGHPGVAAAGVAVG